jgi:hypothetical protein
MAINTNQFNSKPGEIIDIDDIDLEEIDKYFLTEQESRLKETIWKSENADYLIRQQQIKKRHQKLEEKRKLRNKGGIVSQVSEVSQSGLTPA